MVVVCDIAEGVNVREPPALLTTIFGNETDPTGENVAAFAVSKVHVDEDAVIAPPDLRKLPFTVMLGTLRAALLLNVKL